MIWIEPNTWEKMKLSKPEAEKIFNELDENDLIPKKLKEHERKLRERLVASINQAWIPLYEDDRSPSEYELDLHTGLVIYEILNTEFYFNERLAAQDEIWRYFSLLILPDIVYKRVGLNPNRYFKQARRNWLQTIWWYVHLSWQGSKESTFEILEKNTTDTILQLVDRTGINGYRIDFTRALMKEFYQSYNDLPGTERTTLFRRVLKLSTARTKLIEPNLVTGGTEAYVKGLFEYFVKTVNV